MDLQEKLNQVGNKLPSIVNAHAVATIAKQALGHAESLTAKVTDQECLSELNKVITELKKAPDLLLECNKSADSEFRSFDSDKYVALSTHVYNYLDSLIYIKSEYYL